MDEDALVDALQRRAIAGAALDTFDVEPLPEGHPLLTMQLDNTLICPHLGYVIGQHPDLPAPGLRHRRLLPRHVRRRHRGHPRLRQRRAISVSMINEEVLSVTHSSGAIWQVADSEPCPCLVPSLLRGEGEYLSFDTIRRNGHMKAVRINEFGGLDVLKWEDAPDPEPRPHQVLIKVDSAGVNYADLMRRGGNYPGPDLPSSMGLEAAGTVVGSRLRGDRGISGPAGDGHGARRSGGDGGGQRQLRFPLS